MKAYAVYNIVLNTAYVITVKPDYYNCSNSKTKSLLSYLSYIPPFAIRNGAYLSKITNRRIR
jgi:hypothetical protein